MYVPTAGEENSSAKGGMLGALLQRTALKNLTTDGWLLFFTRFARLFAYGALSVVLVLYLTSLGLSESQTGLLLTLTLVGDTLVSLWLTTQADRIGRRRVLRIAGSHGSREAGAVHQRAVVTPAAGRVPELAETLL